MLSVQQHVMGELLHRVVRLLLLEELLEGVILHITPLCHLLHTLLKDKCMCLQDE